MDSLELTGWKILAQVVADIGPDPRAWPNTVPGALLKAQGQALISVPGALIGAAGDAQQRLLAHLQQMIASHSAPPAPPAAAAASSSTAAGPTVAAPAAKV